MRKQSVVLFVHFLTMTTTIRSLYMKGAAQTSASFKVYFPNFPFFKKRSDCKTSADCRAWCEIFNECLKGAKYTF